MTEEELKRLWTFFTNAAARAGAWTSELDERERRALIEAGDTARDLPLCHVALGDAPAADHYLQAHYSLWPHFREIAQQAAARGYTQTLSPLLRCFLGDERASLSHPRILRSGWENFLEGQAYHTPSKHQQAAIRAAIRQPVTFIQGPPGNGKTTVILNLLSCLLQLSPTLRTPLSIAVVSKNNEALQNIKTELAAHAGAGERWDALRRACLFLGASDVRKQITARELNLAQGFDDASDAAPENLPWGAMETRNHHPRYPFRSASTRILGSALVPDTRTDAPWGEEPLTEVPLCTIYTTRRGSVVSPVSLSRTAGVTARACEQRGSPIIFSTINSLRCCFRDGATHRFDYIIMDEASQTGLLDGLLALQHATRLVLVGDLFQLPAVLPQQQADLLNRVLPGDEDLLPQGSVLRFTPAESFFSAAMANLPNEPENSVYLDEHFRCHPGIIDFCNRYIYSVAPDWDPHKRALEKAQAEPGENAPGMEDWPCYRPLVHEPMALNVKTKVTDPAVPVPIGVYWHFGSYGSQDQRRDSRTRWSWRNARQRAIFLEQCWPSLLQRLLDAREKGEDLSFAIISPFRAQLRQLRDELLPLWLDAFGSDAPQLIVSIEEDRADGRPIEDAADENEGHGSLYELCTTHKAQGKGFHIVYFMPTQDAGLEYSMNQDLNLINVMVSRAKRELYIITGLELADPDLRSKLLKWCADKHLPVAPDVAAPDPDQSKSAPKDYFFTKLLTYVAESLGPAAFDREDAFGFHLPAGFEPSVFDALKAERLSRRAQLERDPADPPDSAWRQRADAVTSQIRDILALDAPTRRRRQAREWPDLLNLAYGISATEALVAVALGKVMDRDTTLLQSVPLSCLFSPSALADLDCQLQGIVTLGHLDFVLTDTATGRILAAIEVDGDHHRDVDLRQANDTTKESLLRDKLGCSILNGNRLTAEVDGVSLRGPAALDSLLAHTGFPVLRLPSDGTTWREFDEFAWLEESDRFTVQELVRAARRACDEAKAVHLDVAPLLELAGQAGFPVESERDQAVLFARLGKLQGSARRSYTVLKPEAQLMRGVRLHWLPVGNPAEEANTTLLPILHRMEQPEGEDQPIHTAQPGCPTGLWEKKLLPWLQGRLRAGH